MNKAIGQGMARPAATAAEKASLGTPFEEVAAFALDMAGRVQTYFSVDSLEYLHRGGRIGKAQAFLGISSAWQAAETPTRSANCSVEVINSDRPDPASPMFSQTSAPLFFGNQ